MTKLQAAIDWARDQEWALVANTVAGIVLIIPQFVDELDTQLQSSDGTAIGYVVAVVGILTWAVRSNVWSRATVRNISPAEVE